MSICFSVINGVEKVLGMLLWLFIILLEEMMWEFNVMAHVRRVEIIDLEQR